MLVLQKTLTALLGFQRTAFSKPSGRQKSHRRSFIAVFRNCHFGLPEELGDGSQFVLIFTQLFSHVHQHLQLTFTSTEKPKVHAKVTHRIIQYVVFYGTSDPRAYLSKHVSGSHTGCVICSLRIVAFLLCVNWLDHWNRQPDWFLKISNFNLVWDLTHDIQITW